MRLFIALELSESVKQAMLEAQRQLQTTPLAVRWTAPAAMHLTLVFLGETTQLSEISVALRQALTGQPPLQLSTTEIGAFPTARRPQVLWLGIGGETTALTALQARVAEAMEQLGFPRERRAYSPHLTLGRINKQANAAERSQVATALEHASAPPACSWHAETVTLFESRLHSNGPTYVARDTILLRA